MNTKSQRHLTITKLGTFELTKHDLVNLEKIILKRIKPTDHYVEIGKRKSIELDLSQVYSSARYIPKLDKTYHQLALVTKSPNISVTFNPRSTEIAVPRRYYKDEVLEQLDEAVVELQKYLQKIGEDQSTASKLIHGNRIRL